MDVDAILARKPTVALVDELAHTNVPGSRNEKRWQDVDQLLDAGIDVISTVNIQHLESLNDVVEGITGIKQRETIPDEIVRAADQVELIDQTPEALRRRLAHGNIYAPEKVDAALANYFRPGNLAALRELALLWVADKVDVGLEDYRERHGITAPWETRERVVVAITGAPGTDALIRRAARIAQRAHGDLLGVTCPQRRRPRRPVVRASRAPSQADHRAGRRVPRSGGERHRRRARGVRPSGERDAARARRQSTVALGGTHEWIDHQPGRPTGGGDRPPRHLARGSRRNETPPSVARATASGRSHPSPHDGRFSRGCSASSVCPSSPPAWHSCAIQRACRLSCCSTSRSSSSPQRLEAPSPRWSPRWEPTSRPTSTSRPRSIDGPSTRVRM